MNAWVHFAQAWFARTLLDIGVEGEAEILLSALADHRGEDEQADVIALVAHAHLLGHGGQLAEARETLKEASERVPATAQMFRTDIRVEEIRMLREAGLDDEATTTAVLALSAVEQPPAPLYRLMIQEALDWRRR